MRHINFPTRDSQFLDNAIQHGCDVILDGEKVGEVVAARNRKYNLARGAA